MSGEDATTTSGRQCGQCGGNMELLTYIPKRLGHTAYAVFECLGCGVVEWVSHNDDGS
jgi:hypothetical protein